MKRLLSTCVLVALLLLTVVALNKIDAPQSTTVGRALETHHRSN